MPSFRIKDLTIVLDRPTAFPGGRPSICESSTECGCTSIGTHPCLPTFWDFDPWRFRGDPATLAALKADVHAKLAWLEQAGREQGGQLPQSDAEAAALEKGLADALKEVKAQRARLSKTRK